MSGGFKEDSPGQEDTIQKTEFFLTNNFAIHSAIIKTFSFQGLLGENAYKENNC